MQILSSLLQNLKVASMASSAAPIAEAPSASLIGSVFGSTNVVGGLWMASSALLTTYSTTKFLKYKHADNNPLVPSKKRLHLPRPALLTLFRFGGSLLLGLLLHPDLQLLQRIQNTLSALPSFALSCLSLYCQLRQLFSTE